MRTVRQVQTGQKLSQTNHQQGRVAAILQSLSQGRQLRQTMTNPYTILIMGMCLGFAIGFFVALVLME
jgi:hypothetical protein|tara:strand:+ start:359 stop:562 length:204 start_codon:yes stop_codon:yes gene_type:complete